eukprot:TRINITY_DN357506_c0_g1_i1.p1 TRINITY_DN357506_c0_g1~~TRINITY_DN357506_c0_g1_i1.p1  ORF type:complete len:120 (-),score=10.53 TRINITY_DN357506_c0_g1_i1:89-448(-)
MSFQFVVSKRKVCSLDDGFNHKKRDISKLKGKERTIDVLKQSAKRYNYLHDSSTTFTCIKCSQIASEQHKCSFCEKAGCNMCGIVCEFCGENFCSTCSTIDYSEVHERAVCLQCKDTIN